MCRGNHDEARTFFVQALDLLQTDVPSPPHGPALAMGHLNLNAQDLLPTGGSSGSTTTALLWTLPILFSEVDGQASMSVALRHNVALTFMGEENFADARTWLGLALTEALNAPCSAKNVSLSLCIYRSLGQCLHKLGELNEALLHYCHLCHLQIAVFGSESLEVASTLCLMGRIQFVSSCSDDALQLYQEALRIQQGFYGFDNIVVSNTLNEIGIVLFGEGKAMHDYAIRYFTKSLEIRRRLNGLNDKGNAILLFNLGTTYLETGDEDTTIRLFKEALQVEQKNDSSPKELIKLQELLGLIYQRRGELQESLVSLNQALQVAKENAMPLVAGRMLNMIGNIHLRQASVDDMMRCFVEASRIFRNIPNHDGVLAISGYGYYSLSKRHPECAPLA